MNKEALIEEMLNEVKNLKDLAKDELPLVAKEYLLNQKIQGYIGLSIGMVILLVGAAAGAYAALGTFHHSEDAVSYALSGMIGGLVGFVMTLCNGSSLMDVYLQPRRMAIKAITSLKD